MAGDKQGAWTRWYKANIPIADDRYDAHLEELKKQQEQETTTKPPAKKTRRKKGGN